MYKKWKDNELTKAQRKNWIKLAITEFCIVSFFGVAFLVFLVFHETWWLLCGGVGLAAFLVFIVTPHGRARG